MALIRHLPALLRLLPLLLAGHALAQASDKSGEAACVTP